MTTRLLLGLLAAAIGADAEEVLEIARRGLPFVKEKGHAWIEGRQCASCHQIPSMLWSLNSAARLGLDVEREEVAKWTRWAVDWRHWNQTGDKEGVDKVFPLRPHGRRNFARKSSRISSLTARGNPEANSPSASDRRVRSPR